MKGLRRHQDFSCMGLLRWDSRPELLSGARLGKRPLVNYVGTEQFPPISAISPLCKACWDL